ncbi:hypothetical protein K402DRAFT_421462 [Aulographum hederae CBS 113979]|uniref:Uncharacterized protein n=1 Tax=Aulographum hederae CBS 113979 TaxID=1176131 RepID=A0A6G1GZ60_9PEZI|nr:hypothetical protein K402DRAFT_421462 [Aulographum hederae CBS 113979]
MFKNLSRPSRRSQRKASQKILGDPNNATPSRWRRIVRACFVSSNPDPDEASNNSPPPTPPKHFLNISSPRPISRARTSYRENAPSEPPSTPLEDLDFDAKRKRRASYIPQHAQSDFSRTTTPLPLRNPTEAKRASRVYGTTLRAVPQRTESEWETLRRRRNTLGI